MTTSDPTGGDKVAYFGVINVNENGKTIGSVDIWRSLLTKELFCEEKRLGMLDIVDYIGMPRIDKEKKWAVAINRKKSGHMRWKLVKLIQDGNFSFTDADDKQVQVQVKEFSINDAEWWSFLVEKNVNKNVEVAVEPKK